MEIQFNVTISGVKAIDDLNADMPLNSSVPSSVNLMNITGLSNSAQLAANIVLSPNPNHTEQLSIAATDVQFQSIVLYNMLGQQVFEQPNIDNTTRLTLQLPTLAKGVYMVFIQTDKGCVTKKVVMD